MNLILFQSMMAAAALGAGLALPVSAQSSSPAFPPLLKAPVPENGQDAGVSHSAEDDQERWFRDGSGPEAVGRAG